ncbi:MAG: hypothetical protein DRR19_13545 [Candidatus Parabeggiatoa sp. nov. 1]|nr:MAG: hypothetical protein DRR19_13545 [Gammaproteobacteria bacterium]
MFLNKFLNDELFAVHYLPYANEGIVTLFNILLTITLRCNYLGLWQSQTASCNRTAQKKFHAIFLSFKAITIHYRLLIAYNCPLLFIV